MVTKVTSGIRVSVETEFRTDYSHDGNYMFSYFITIENYTDQSVQLLSRKWVIVDSDGEKTAIEGEGVVGQQPIIQPGGTHRYSSGCNLKTPLGKMRGFYQMIRISDSLIFSVEIPEFILAAPFIEN